MTRLARAGGGRSRTSAGRFGKPYLYEPECASTQQLLLGSGLPEGRRRRHRPSDGRTRDGSGGVGGTRRNLAARLRPARIRRPERRLPELSLVAALAAAETVEAASASSTQVKWPNDVMLNRRKVAGILSELSDGTVVVGIGMNVNQTREQLPLDAPTEPGRCEPSPGDATTCGLLGSLLFRLERKYDAGARRARRALR